MKALITINMAALIFSGCAAHSTSLEGIKTELQTIRTAQQQILDSGLVSKANTSLFDKYDRTENIDLYIRWNEIVNSKDFHSLNFIDDTKRWIRYSVLEALRFELSDDDFDAVERQIEEVTAMGEPYADSSNNNMFVVAQDLNLRDAPIVSDKTVRKVLSKGTFIQAHYEIQFLQNGEMTRWANISTDSGEKGWVNTAYLFQVTKNH